MITKNGTIIMVNTKMSPFVWGKKSRSSGTLCNTFLSSRVTKGQTKVEQEGDMKAYCRFQALLQIPASGSKYMRSN